LIEKKLKNTPKDAEIYDETDEYIIIDNKENIPMIIWKDKYVVKDIQIARTMKKAINEVGKKKYGNGNFFIDRFPEGDEIYLTWYCKPNIRENFINHNPYG